MNSPPVGGSHYWVGDIFVDEVHQEGVVTIGLVISLWMNSPPGLVVTIGLVISLWMNSPPGVGSHYWVGDILVDEQSTRSG